MHIQEMALLAKQHWKAHYPDGYNLLVKDKALESEALAAAKLTRSEMDTLLTPPGFMTEAQAWEQARSLFILTDPLKEYHPD